MVFFVLSCQKGLAYPMVKLLQVKATIIIRKRNNMWSFLKGLFKKKNEMKVDTKAETIPQASGYPESDYSILVKELTEIIQPNDRLRSFAEYLKNPTFDKLHLDLQN